jgi:hypothetical protein
MLLILQSHRYKKGEEFSENRDFSIIRDPMYKFSSEAKDRFFANINMAFFFHYFVLNGANEFFITQKGPVKNDLYMNKLKEAIIRLDRDSLMGLRSEPKKM